MTSWSSWLPVGHLALCVVILSWDIVLAGRISQLREAPRVFAAVTGLSALLLLPAVILLLATSTVITDRAVAMVDWLWPSVLVLFAIQAVYAVARRLVNIFWGLPIAVYDAVIATTAVTRYLIAHGMVPALPFVTLVAAQSATMALSFSSIAAASPFYFNVPMIAPAFPALGRFSGLFRPAMAVVAIGWTVLIFTIGLDGATQATAGYRKHANDPIHERPKGDFAIGLKILPDVRSSPAPAAVRSDLALFDTLYPAAVEVVVEPGATQLVLDSVSHVLDRIRGDSMPVVVAIGYRGKLLPELGRAPFSEAERLATVQRVMRRLHPTILLPAEDPYGVGARVLGRIAVTQWEQYLTAAAHAAKAIDSHVRVGVSATRFGQSDSALYAWAAQPESPIDVLGFSLFPDTHGLSDLDETFERAADRWMSEIPSNKPIWVFGSGGFPLEFGELAQQRAISQVLSWATNHSAIKGMIVDEAGDYGEARGLRAPNGRLRAAALWVRMAIQTLDATATPGR